MLRVKTGISGFDELINGGFPKVNLVLLSGLTGSGKTIFATQYLVNGVKQYNERGLLISFEQIREDIIDQSNELGWDLLKLEKEKKLKVVTYTPNKMIFSAVLQEIKALIQEFKPDRIVLDSISTYGIYAETIAYIEILEKMGMQKSQFSFQLGPEVATRKAIVDMLEALKNQKATSIIISELPESTNFLSRDTISEFLCDGVVLLKHVSIGDSLNRNLEVRKMRKTDIRGCPRTYNITAKGIVIEAGG